MFKFSLRVGCGSLLSLFLGLFFLNYHPLTNESNLDSPKLTKAVNGICSSRNVTRFVFVGYPSVWERQTPYICDCGNDDPVNVSTVDLSGDGREIVGAKSILFSWGRGIAKPLWENLVALREPTQTWIIATRESPDSNWEVIGPPKVFHDTTFDMVFSYHSSSDFPNPYGRYIPFKNVENQELTYLHRPKKTRLVMWMSSHCPLKVTKWKRQRFVQDLAKYLPVDMYGKCGDKTCPFGSKDCSDLVHSYKFILALENSCCSEYITEKFWRAFDNWQIPIVFGAYREDYLRLGPPKSFIFAEDFNSLEELADFVTAVANNESLYLSFHEWRKFGFTTRPDSWMTAQPNDCQHICSINKKLNVPMNQRNVLRFSDTTSKEWYGSCRDCNERIATLREKK